MYLLFGTHNHQPVGNFGEVFQRANRDCYRPFIEILGQYQEIKATIHFSGSLIDWLLKHDPSLLQKVKEMVNRHQVELLTGGYYEPILPIIPQRDRLGQIKMLSDFIKDYFEFTPQGMWLSERVWEPQLVKTLVEAGVKYILLDDSHFLHSGIQEKELLGYYVTEEEGLTLCVFPIMKRLRYIIPFSPPLEPINYLKSLGRQEPTLAATIVDDGEKFGLWPGTQQWVYRGKWLERFFQLLLTNQDWLKTETISGYMQKQKPRGLCFLPCASYEEMMGWSGGFFQNFLVKYPEVNNLQKRMLYVSERLHQQKEAPAQAKRHLYMAQSNCPYWHGVFGGIYLKHLRSEAYKNLLIAQNLLEQNDQTEQSGIESFDFDKDGQDELMIQNGLLNVFIAPQMGGAIFELDYRPQALNLADGMTRQPEAYHEQMKSRVKKTFRLKKKRPSSIHDLLISKEKGLEGLLIYDTYRRLSLVDHFFPPTLSLKAFKGGQDVELGDFIQGQYGVVKDKEAKALSVALQRDGTVLYKGSRIPLSITKRLSLNHSEPKITVEYALEAFTKKTYELLFGVEFNLSCSGQQAPNVLHCHSSGGHKSYTLADDVIGKEVKELRLDDATGGIEMTFHFDHQPHLWSYPLQTISASEQGFERNYQQSVILSLWPVMLGQVWQTKITFSVKTKAV